MSHWKVTLVVAALLMALVVLMVYLTRSKHHQYISTPAVASVPRATKAAELQKPQPKGNPYAVVPGGARNLEEARSLIASLKKSSKAYMGINVDLLFPLRLTTPMYGYMAYRRGDHIFFTKKIVTLPEGEIVFTDGIHLIRWGCINLFSPVPMFPTSPLEPTEQELMDVPEPPPLLTYNPGSPGVPGGEFPPAASPPAQPTTPTGAPVPPPVSGAPPSKGGPPFIPVPVPIPITGGHHPSPPPVKVAVTPEPNDVLLVGLALVVTTLVVRKRKMKT
jgi:hypothetical protein